ncbi:MAG: hypothetical protein ACYC66_00280 [Chloroflexota bacterium]
MRAQVSLTVPEGKLLIARAIGSLSEVRYALENGRILLKGGTTVSALAEELVGVRLRISGRISPRGAKSSGTGLRTTPHSILIEGGRWRNVDDDLPEAVTRMGPRDVAVLGANIIDTQGRAAMMAGRALGGNPGQVMTGLMAQGVQVIVAAGLEKLIPGSVDDAVRQAGMAGCDWSMGMSVGLMPIVGRVITEVEAIRTIAPVVCAIIGRGGIDGASGGATFSVAGEAADVQRVIDAVIAVKGAGTSGSSESWPECRAGSPNCREHRCCVWKQWGKGGWGKWEAESERSAQLRSDNRLEPT